jgi:hypothetical protein
VPGRWRNEEDALLARHYAAGVVRREIAARLGRSEDALDARRRTLGIPARRGTRPWSATEDALLRAAEAAGVPASELATRIGRPPDAVRRRRRELGLAVQAPGRRYSALEDGALRRLWLAGGDLAALAVELGRSPASLRLRARALDLHSPVARLRWLPGEDLVLRQAYGLGLTCTAISDEALPGRSARAIAARARKLGIAVYGRIWSTDEHRRLAALTAERTPLEEVAALLFRTPEAVRRRARKLGLEPLRPAPHENAHRRWRREEDALLRRHASHDPVSLARLLGRSDHAVRRRLAVLGLRRGRERSPHHELVASASLTPAERRLVARELAGGSARRLLSLSRRLGRSPGALKRMVLEPNGIGAAGHR